MDADPAACSMLEHAAVLVSDILCYLGSGLVNYVFWGSELVNYVCVYAQASTKVPAMRARMGSKGMMNTSSTGYERKGGHSLGFTRGEMTSSIQCSVT